MIFVHYQWRNEKFKSSFLTQGKNAQSVGEDFWLHAGAHTERQPKRQVASLKFAACRSVCSCPNASCFNAVQVSVLE